LAARGGVGGRGNGPTRVCHQYCCVVIAPSAQASILAGEAPSQTDTTVRCDFGFSRPRPGQRRSVGSQPSAEGAVAGRFYVEEDGHLPWGWCGAVCPVSGAKVNCAITDIVWKTAELDGPEGAVAVLFQEVVDGAVRAYRREDLRWHEHPRMFRRGPRRLPTARVGVPAQHSRHWQVHSVSCRALSIVALPACGIPGRAGVHLRGGGRLSQVGSVG